MVNDNLITRFIKTYVNSFDIGPEEYRTAGLAGSITGIDDRINLYGYNIYNPNTVDVFIKIFEKSSMPNALSDAPVITLQVPAMGSIVYLGTDCLRRFNNVMWIVASTAYQDFSAIAAPTNQLLAHIYYK